MLLKRSITDRLIEWKQKAGRLPLILWGARQVGKSTIVEAFGAASFPRTHVFNFQQNVSLQTAFRGDLKTAEILKALELMAGTTIAPHELIFFDEIQECPDALTSLKYFAETIPEQAIIAAGSYLGLVKNEPSFPVGKVDFLSLHPMSYLEFLENVEPQTHAHLTGQPLFAEPPIAEFYHQRALHWLRSYLCVGGMPASVLAYVSLKNSEVQALQAARAIQKGLITGYESDFSKHSGTVNANHILRVFEAAATQLGRAQDETVNRFRFSNVIPKKKGFEAIDGPLTWLEKSRLVIKTYIADQFEQPIKAFTQPNRFKAYLLDVGLLNAMLDVPPEALILGALGTYKGYLAENFVAQELFSATDRPLIGWSEGQSEIEFVVSIGSHLCPIEVKASSRSRRARSLETLSNKYRPELSIKLTGQNRGCSADRKAWTLPIYLAGKVLESGK